LNTRVCRDDDARRVGAPAPAPPPSLTGTRARAVSGTRPRVPDAPASRSPSGRPSASLPPRASLPRASAAARGFSSPPPPLASPPRVVSSLRMPKSRRDKVVALTQTKKKDREWKGGLIDSIRAALDEYSGVFVFRCANLRNNVFKDMKADLRDSSRFFMGSNKVMQVALGKGPEDEQRDGLHKLSSHVRGHAGVCFSNLSAADLASALERYATADFARTGSVASETVVVERGPVRGPHGGLMEHTMEPTLRKNGMPTKLNRGVIELLADHVVCKEGEHVSPQAAILLRLFGKALATFEIALVCGWVRTPTPRRRLRLFFPPIAIPPPFSSIPSSARRRP
jgi:mRNA turnover protein 4